ncbi:ABC transporter permease [Nocardioides sp. URHA0020]|uniref:ABC transporter permease n=1 Tax=Nocardioides sp. URHA0020 TaxID=1380392 RepID=UPI000490FD4D|nr:ABC transporter permease [Nocardioides sp. URHA0020]
MRWLRSWRLPLRLARREAARARGRSVLVLVMIALPVLAVTAADVVIQTAQVSAAEGLDRRLGSADALITYQPGSGQVFQDVDPTVSTSNGTGDTEQVLPELAEVEQAVGPGTTGISWDQGSVGVETAKGVSDTEVSELDLRDPLSDGIFDVTSGRPAAATDEIVINHELADRGFDLGDELTVRGGATYTVVGIGDGTSYHGYPMAVGLPGSLGLAEKRYQASFLVGGGAVSWDQVRELNAEGALVLSRAVVLDPPPRSEIPDEVKAFESGTDSAMVAVIVLIVVMALIEVVLLAGPAFAVGARRQSRALALMAATGGTPRQARRVVLANGVVLGGIGAILGVLVGLVVAWLSLPIVQHFSDERLGPFDVPWPHLLGIAAFGLLSALLAAVVPAWIASRQDVVAVLAGRRGDRRPSLRSPLLGLVLLGVGIAGAVLGASGRGEFFIAGAAIAAVLGMILLVPVVLVAVARLARRFPLTLRYAVRDAARHRSRTVPAVAAVAATVAGVVALGIGVTSDEAENEGTYVASLPMGTGVVTDAFAEGEQWDTLRAATLRGLPEATVTPMQGVAEGGDEEKTSYYVEVLVPGSDDSEEDTRLLEYSSSVFGSSVLVGDELPSALDLPASARGPAAATLRSGGAVVFTDRGVESERIEVVAHRYDPDATDEKVTRVTVPALVVPVADGRSAPVAVVTTATAERVGVPVGTMGLAVTGAGVSEQQESDAQEALAGIDENATLYVERGYQTDDETVIVQLVLGALGAVLMLGGTLTATFLALSDARADLATLSAVGAAPRTRRGVAAAYALVVGMVGAALGAAVGLIPGIAVSYPLTRGYEPGAAAHYLDIPWLLIVGLVVVLPLLTALVVGLSARSRLPLVARLD